MTIIDPKKPSPLRRFLPAGGLIAVGLVLGTFLGVAAVGGAPKAAEPQPAETITVTEEVLVDDGCREVAEELYSIMTRLHEHIVTPLIEANQATYDGDYATAVIKMEGVNAEFPGLTSRVQAIGPDYQACVR